MQLSCYHLDSKNTTHYINKKFIKKLQHESFRNSLQPCIWNKKSLEILLKSGENPWVFESAGNLRSQGHERPFFTSPADKNIIDFTNGCFIGFINQKTIDFLKTENIEIEKRSLPLREDNRFKVWWRAYFLPYLYNDIWVPTKKFISSIT